MRKNLLTLLTILFATIAANAASQQWMRFHCANDTTEINQLLKKGYDSKISDPNELMIFYSHELMGTPYVAHTLEGDNELLTINIDQLDCTTFVETLYALTRTTLNGRYSWRDFANNLESIRYRNGQMDGYPSRLHYVSDWIIDNTHRGNIEEISSSIPNARYETKTLDYMSAHRNLYPALADSATFAQFKTFEIAYRMHRFPYVNKNSVNSNKVTEKLKSGDIIAIVTKTEGLDVSHMAIIVSDEKGKFHMLHASSDEKKVVIGSSHFVFEDERCTVRPEKQEAFDALPAEYSHLYLAIDGELTAVICIEDPLREEAADMVRLLKAEGISKVVMMTGDSERTAASIAGRVGVDEYYAEVLPEDKARFVENEKASGRKVIMIGDGINDSPALSAADAGIAISDGAEIAREIADITIAADDLRELVTLKHLSNQLMKRIHRNYRAIVGINAGLIGLGVGGVIQPTTSALLHNTSTIVISLKSMQNLLPEEAQAKK